LRTAEIDPDPDCDCDYDYDCEIEIARETVTEIAIGFNGFSQFNTP